MLPISLKNICSLSLVLEFINSFLDIMIPEGSNLPVDELHEYISRLDFYKDLKETEQSIKRNIEYDDVEVPTLQKQDSAINVPLRFLTESSYSDVWKRLFMYETRGQILKAKLQQAKDAEKVEHVSTEEIKPFRFLTFKRLNLKSQTNYSNGSLVMLSPNEILNDTPVAHLLGFIDSNEELRVKVIFDEILKKKNPQQWDRFNSTKEWNIKLLCGIVTIEREFKALENFKNIDPTIKKTILNPTELINCLEDRFHIPEQLDAKLKQIYNEFQYKAIHQCLKKQGTTLIQGPPGTGKTRTVLGTLSVLTNSFNVVAETSSEIVHRQQKQDKSKLLKANPWFTDDFVDWRDEVILQLPINLKRFDATKKYLKSLHTDNQITIKKREQDIMLPGKILICGPSNAAVDEIIRKVLEEGLLDNKGRKFNPQIVRVGDKYDKSLENVSLDHLANLELMKNQKQDINFYRNKILRNSRIVCGTLSAVGHQFLQNAGIDFDTVVIDQACQAVEVSTLIPMSYGCKRLILIGDPNQLPSTVFSRLCIKQGYDQSLFERMMKCGYPVNVLKTQYRMHPDISSIIGNAFYGGILLDSPSVNREYFYKAFGSFMFLHVPKSSEVKSRRSFKNIVEEKPIKVLATYLQQIGCNDIGILSPYSQQISYLNNQKFSKACEIKTIDSFQGREKSVIIFNTVRAGLKGQPKQVKRNKKKTIGFLSDKRRINVGLSRAKHLCVVVGDANWLYKFEIWHDIIKQALERQQVFEFKDEVKDYFKAFVENRNTFLKTKIDNL